jgi:DNA-binding transcriptional ArsR family regulator
MHAKNGQAPVCRCDLAELVLEPLASQVDQVRLQILDKLQDINDSIEIIAREIARQIVRDR